MMRDRVMGIENEFGAVIESPDGSFDYLPTDGPYDTLVVGETLNMQLEKQRDKLGFMRMKNRLWFPNGGCLYIDQGHFEYASPECRRVRDIVAYSRAGEALAEKVASERFYSGSRFRLIKNNVALSAATGMTEPVKTKYVTFGAHENYLFFENGESGLFSSGPESEIKQGNYFRAFMAFLVTRQIIDGAGRWIDEPKNAYIFSQRALFIEKEFEMGTTGARSIINKRSEHHIDDGSLDPPEHLKGMKRLHLILGDANILDAALFLKIGTTKLVLSLLEEGKMPNVKMRDPVKANRDVSLVYSPTTPCIELEDGTMVSAFYVQSAFYEKARHYLSHTCFESEESEAEAKEILSLWERALKALESTDMEWMVGRLDHVTKNFIAQQEIKRQRRENPPVFEEAVVAAIEIQYHELGDDALSSKMRAKWSSRCIVTDEEVLRAIENPPPDTRACARGLIVRAYLEKKIPLQDVDWSKIQIGTSPIGSVSGAQMYPVYQSPDPLIARPSWLYEFCPGM
ncbi:MAG: proteasome accessory factor PafA2 family protein [Patescibacteria group bacterium]